ncbi:MAG: fatty acid desaturase [Candidatus Sericytochromatia bacterium]
MKLDKKLENNDLIYNIDLDNFFNEIEAIKKEIDSNLNYNDFKHLKKIERWSNLLTILGYLTSFISINPLSPILIGMGNTTRWGCIVHHISHKAFDKIDGVPKRYTSKGFAVGKRRFLDWLDWLYPLAWNYEHNILHHYHTGEIYDPDLVEKHTEIIRTNKVPTFIKYFILIFFMCTWKLIYYAPNTLWVLQESRKNLKQKKKAREVLDHIDSLYAGTKIILPVNKGGLELWAKCILPYIGIRFLLIPSLFLPLGEKAFYYVLINSILGEIVANIYSFIIIGPNHTGDDLYRFDTTVKNKKEFYFRQVIGSVNYPCGTDLKDFLYCGLNYQIEHHLWPDIPMSKYQQYQPKVKAICEKYNVPYVQEGVFRRLVKMFEIMTGKKSLKKY